MDRIPALVNTNRYSQNLRSEFPNGKRSEDNSIGKIHLRRTFIPCDDYSSYYNVNYLGPQIKIDGSFVSETDFEKVRQIRADLCGGDYGKECNQIQMECPGFPLNSIDELNKLIALIKKEENDYTPGYGLPENSLYNFPIVDCNVYELAPDMDYESLQEGYDKTCQLLDWGLPNDICNDLEDNPSPWSLKHNLQRKTNIALAAAQNAGVFSHENCPVYPDAIRYNSITPFPTPTPIPENMSVTEMILWGSLGVLVVSASINLIHRATKYYKDNR
ncbi:hypothetical protein HOG98_05150 [bacterium]|jgi:hypothetical protein|nr:hypothetical protein [bacterium]